MVATVIAGLWSLMSGTVVVMALQRVTAWTVGLRATQKAIAPKPKYRTPVQKSFGLFMIDDTVSPLSLAFPPAKQRGAN